MSEQIQNGGRPLSCQCNRFDVCDTCYRRAALRKSRTRRDAIRKTTPPIAAWKLCATCGTRRTPYTCAGDLRTFRLHEAPLCTPCAVAIQISGSGSPLLLCRACAQQGIALIAQVI